MKVVCVCVPPLYQDHDYVGRLYRGLMRHTTRPFEFDCIIKSRWPGWWAKLDLFPAKTRTIYLDLDTVICGNVDFLFDYEGEFCVRRNPWAGTGALDVSLIAMAEGYGQDIADKFLADPQAVMDRYRSDQEFLSEIVKRVDFWQDIAPGRTASYKADSLEAGPNGASIIGFHGIPKPHELERGHWAKEAWQ